MSFISGLRIIEKRYNNYRFSASENIFTFNPGRLSHCHIMPAVLVSVRHYIKVAI